jgi:hypothetical protein
VTTPAGPPAPAATPAPASGAIHDLGYKRYVGTRRSVWTRWRVIARQQISAAWKGWWRFKLSLGIAIVTMIVAGMFIYVATNKTIGGVTGGRSLTFADWAMPVTVSWSCRAAFIFSLTVSAGVIAGDLKSGAFTFYFARSIRPIDYLLGKLAGVGTMIFLIMFMPPVIVVGLRLGLVSSTDELVAHLGMIPKMMAVGMIGTIAFTAIPLGFSALVSNRRYALGLWAAYYIVFGFLALAAGVASKSQIASLDIAQSIISLCNNWLGTTLPGGKLDIQPAYAMLSLVGQSAMAIMIVWWQLANAQRSGVGGSG